MHLQSKIYIAGHKGLVGSSLVRKLELEGYQNLLVRTHRDLDLTNQELVYSFFQREKPDYVFLAAAKVGGILANKNYPAEFIYQNLNIQSNVIDASWRSGVKRLLFLGSSCIYPKECPQPIKEEYLLSAPLEPTNQAYAIAKIAGIEMCRSYNQQYGTQYLCTMPTNLYGPGDNYDLETSHVLPALIRKMHMAKMENQPSVEIWGSGKPRREFLYSDDLSDACVHLMKLPDQEFNSLVFNGPAPLINIGTGEDLTIAELANAVAKVIEFEGELVYDISKPDGTMRKRLDVSKIYRLGWKPQTNLVQGIKLSYDDWLNRKLECLS